MRRLELAAGMALILSAAFVFVATSGLAYWARLVPGPGFMPFWVAIVASLFGVALVLGALLGTSDEPAGLPGGRVFGRTLVVYGALWLLVFAAPFAGFLLAAISFMLLLLLGVFRRPLGPSLLATAIIAALVHFLFNLWLDVRLPTGPFGL